MSFKSYLKLLGNVTQHKIAARTVNMTPETNTLLSAFIKDCEQPYVPENIKTLFKGVDNPYVNRFYSRPKCNSVHIETLEMLKNDFKNYYNSEGFLVFHEKKLPMIKKIGSKLKQFEKQCLIASEQKRIKQFKKNQAIGNYNSNPIKYFTFTTTKEAVKILKQNGFTKYVRGVRKDNPQDLEILNLLNESLCDIHNLTKGRSYMPKKIIIVDEIKSADGKYALASYSPIDGTLKVQRKYTFGKDTIYHEIGHANHSLNTDILTMAREGECKARGEHDARITYNFMQEHELQNLIYKYMREYAQTPAEFCADHFKYVILGTPLPKQLHKANEALQGFDWSKTNHRLLVAA